MIDRKPFFDKIRTTLFGGSLSSPQVFGITAILDEWDRRALTDLRFLGYMLATTFHETAETMQPIREFGRGKGMKYGTTYYGRGFVQLTWDFNYRKASTATGVDLMADPDRALELPIATQILFEGMIVGWFTGKRLADYFNATVSDWVNARRIINGTDRAELIADYGHKFYDALQTQVAPPALPPDVPAPNPAAPSTPAQAAPRGFLASLAAFFSWFT